jgi:hypothetical protein
MRHTRRGHIGVSGHQLVPPRPGDEIGWGGGGGERHARRRGPHGAGVAGRPACWGAGGGGGGAGALGAAPSAWASTHCASSSPPPAPAPIHHLLVLLHPTLPTRNPARSNARPQRPTLPAGPAARPQRPSGRPIPFFIDPEAPEPCQIAAGAQRDAAAVVAQNRAGAPCGEAGTGARPPAASGRPLAAPQAAAAGSSGGAPADTAARRPAPADTAAPPAPTRPPPPPCPRTRSWLSSRMGRPTTATS